jgi:energy-coupling factor transporter ATP-binding protein EcfA2
MKRAMYLLNLEVENLRRMRHLSCSFERAGAPRMWTVLLGRSGLGKTTLLRTVAMAATGHVRANQLADGQIPTLRDNRRPTAAVEIGARFGFSKEPHERRTYPGLPLQLADPPQLVSTLGLEPGESLLEGESCYLGLGRTIADPLVDARSSGALQHWFVAGYGASRSLPPPGASEPHREPLLSRLLSLFDKGQLLGTRIMEELTHRAEYLKTLQEIPSGDQATMDWVADLVGHIFLDAKGPVCAAKMEGIVLVDEIDRNVPPAWQAELIPTLERVFPRLQFIVTAHSPMLLSGLEQDEIVLLEEDEEGSVVARPAPGSPPS